MSHVEWWSPPEMVGVLGPFDLDPCAGPETCLARQNISLPVDGLLDEWHGRVWLNPPYNDIAPWMDRLASHGDGIALVFARTDTAWFQEAVFGRASALLFLRGRVAFVRPGADGRRSHSPAPSVLVAYGTTNAQALKMSGLGGVNVALDTEATVR